eukprot:1019571-Prorocentrum_minimum.AAC.1
MLPLSAPVYMSIISTCSRLARSHPIGTARAPGARSSIHCTADLAEPSDRPTTTTSSPLAASWSATWPYQHRRIRSVDARLVPGRPHAILNGQRSTVKA